MVSWQQLQLASHVMFLEAEPLNIIQNSIDWNSETLDLDFMEKKIIFLVPAKPPYDT